jgi:hypothetical protein
MTGELRTEIKVLIIANGIMTIARIIENVEGRRHRPSERFEFTQHADRSIARAQVEIAFISKRNF